MCGHHCTTNGDAASGQGRWVSSLSGLAGLLRLNKDIPEPLQSTRIMNNDRSTPYLLLFRNSGPETHRHLSPEQLQQLVTRWNAWYDGLVAQGKATEGQPLELETRVVSGSGGSKVVDGPFAEAKEAVGGYVKLRVGDRAEATAIAQAHPGLEYGLIIEIRALVSACHLGVSGH